MFLLLLYYIQDTRRWSWMSGFNLVRRKWIQAKSWQFISQTNKPFMKQWLRSTATTGPDCDANGRRMWRSVVWAIGPQSDLNVNTRDTLIISRYNLDLKHILMQGVKGGTVSHLINWSHFLRYIIWKISSSYQMDKVEWKVQHFTLKCSRVGNTPPKHLQTEHKYTIWINVPKSFQLLVTTYKPVTIRDKLIALKHCIEPGVVNRIATGD